MKKFIISALVLCLAKLSGAQDLGIINNANSPYSQLKSINMGDCSWTGGFWAERFEVMHNVGIPNMWGLLDNPDIMHSKQNFMIAGGAMEGNHVGTNWIDGDTYKWLEAVAYVYAITHDQKLDQLMDEMIGYIRMAQQADGYINTHMTIPGKEHFQNVQDHETYNMGHLLTAGCIHFRATGKTEFLDIATKAAECLYSTFMNTDKHFLGYSSIMGLVELYRTTNEERYLALAKHFVDIQGAGDVHGRQSGSWLGMGQAGRQDHIPVRETTDAVGHAVRGNYLYCGVADVAAETGDKSLLNALETIWKSVDTKAYITGGVSSQTVGATKERHVVWEAYSNDYHLDNCDAYNETCSGIGWAMWNWRMYLITGEPKYLNVLENVIYNTGLSPIGLDGKSFFYTNPVRRVNGVHLSHERDSTRWAHQMGFCCPPNVVRTLSKLSGWAYSLTDNGIAVNLYGGNKLTTKMLDGTAIELTQETQYPWEGEVKITIGQCKKESFDVQLRIPDWAENSTLSVNGIDAGVSVQAGSFAIINREWKNGDVISLNMPMTIELTEGNPLIEEIRNEVAVKRGPIVYCIESPDLPLKTSILDVYLPSSSKLVAEFQPELLGGVTTISADVKIRNEQAGGMYHQLKKPEWKTVSTRFIPYYAWDNRGQAEMTVWLPYMWGE